MDSSSQREHSMDFDLRCLRFIENQEQKETITQPNVLISPLVLAVLLEFFGEYYRELRDEILHLIGEKYKSLHISTALRVFAMLAGVSTEKNSQLDVEFPHMIRARWDRDFINQTAKHHTNGLIEEVIPDWLSYKPPLFLACVAAKSKWTHPFHSETKNRTFHLRKGVYKMHHPFMYFRDFKPTLAYWQTKHLKTIVLPTQDGFSVHFTMPNCDLSLSDSRQYRDEWIEHTTRNHKRMSQTDRHVIEIPRFDLFETYDFYEVLQVIGLENISKRMQDKFTVPQPFGLKTVRVRVDTNGFEAASSVVLCDSYCHIPHTEASPVITWIGDRPFAFTIRTTQQILFHGIVNDPIMTC